jgi:hypothetical protein
VNILPPPGPQRRRQLILLAVTVIALAFVLRSYWLPSAPAAGTAPASNSQTTQGAGIALAASQLPEPLKLAELEPVPDAPEAGRNPFRFGVRPPPPPPPPTKVVAPPPAPPPPPPGPPPVPPIRLELVGLHNLPEGRVLVTLRDPGTNAIFQVFEGQIVDGRYRLVKVGLQSVVVAHLDGTNPRTLTAR